MAKTDILVVRFLKAVTVMLAAVLMAKEIYNYRVTKPTSVDKTTTNMKFSLAPEMLICPQPAFDLISLNKLNYSGTISQLNVFLLLELNRKTLFRSI